MKTAFIINITYILIYSIPVNSSINKIQISNVYRSLSITGINKYIILINHNFLKIFY